MKKQRRLAFFLFFASPNTEGTITDAAIHGDVMGSDYCSVSLTLNIRE